MPKVSARHGDIFEGGVDVTVLPCSGKGSISSATRRWVDLFGLPVPTSLSNHPRLGEVSELIPFPGDQSKTRFVVYAASVFNDASGIAAIESIARRLGELTASQPELRLVECPVLGTGAGRLSAQEAVSALQRGFASSAAADAELLVFAFAATFKAIATALEPKASRVWDAVNLRPGMFGISLDLKKLLRGRKN